MPSPLALAVDPRVVAFRGVVLILKGAGPLRRILGDRWKIPGDPAFDDPLPTNGPWCRLTPRLTEAGRRAFRGGGLTATESPLAVQVELRLPGFSWEDSVALWRQFELALMPQSGRAAFDANLATTYGISDIEVTQPASTSDPNVTAVGEFRITVYVPT